MRADRLLSIIWLLRSHQQLSAGELAAELEVSPRTIMRDIDALSAAGVPIYCERGPHGGVRLLPGYRTDVTSLTRDESRALFASMTDWGANSLGLSDALASGRRKLLAAVPDHYRAASLSTSSRIIIDPQGWLPQSESERLGVVFKTVQEAVLTQHILRLTYQGKTTASLNWMNVHPHGLISAGSAWYLCASRNDDLLFLKVSRIGEATISPEVCDATKDINVEKAWERRQAQFRKSFSPITAVAWIHQNRLRDVSEWAIKSEEVTLPTPSQQKPGWLHMKLQFVDHLHALTIMLKLGSDAILESPKELRKDLINVLKQTLDNYREA